MPTFINLSLLILLLLVIYLLLVSNTKFPFNTVSTSTNTIANTLFSNTNLPNTNLSNTTTLFPVISTSVYTTQNQFDNVQPALCFAFSQLYTNNTRPIQSQSYYP